MYHKIMLPIDIAGTKNLEKAVQTAADLAKYYKIPICFVSAASSAPGKAAHTPPEHAARLATFAAEQAKRYGILATSMAPVAHDPAADLHRVLLHAIDETGADLVVMGSHVPGIAEFIIASNAGAVASHAQVSVFVVR